MASSSSLAPSVPSTSFATVVQRRRQRSVRVTVAVALLVAASVVVLAALPAQAPLWLSVSSVVALLCGWAAARIGYAELTQCRRDAATDRAAQARAYRAMFLERVAEHDEFTQAMAERLSRRDRAISYLESRVRGADLRTRAAEARVQRETRQSVEAQTRVQELAERVAELEVAQAESSDELATWQGEKTPGRAPDPATVGDLVAWEQRASASAAPDERGRQRA